MMSGVLDMGERYCAFGKMSTFGNGMLVEIKLGAPLVEVVCPDETAAADEAAAVVDVIEYCGSHAAVAWGCGEVVGVWTEDAFTAAVFAARVEWKEITFALEADDVGIFGEQVLVCGVE